MRFDDRFLEELKARLRPSDVIGRSVKLKRQGREWVGLSPFSKEKSPSFFVNDDKGFYHDFSSGKHGDVISFLQEVERLSFPEAVERLAVASELEVGGVEYLIDDRDGSVLFYDINGLSNFVAKPVEVLGFDPHDDLVDWLKTIVAEEKSKRPEGIAA